MLAVFAVLSVCLLALTWSSLVVRGVGAAQRCLRHNHMHFCVCGDASHVWFSHHGMALQIAAHQSCGPHSCCALESQHLFVGVAVLVCWGDCVCVWHSGRADQAVPSCVGILGTLHVVGCV